MCTIRGGKTSNNFVANFYFILNTPTYNHVRRIMLSGWGSTGELCMKMHVLPAQ